MNPFSSRNRLKRMRRDNRVGSLSWEVSPVIPRRPLLLILYYHLDVKLLQQRRENARSPRPTELHPKPSASPRLIPELLGASNLVRQPADLLSPTAPAGGDTISRPSLQDVQERLLQFLPHICNAIPSCYFRPFPHNLFPKQWVVSDSQDPLSNGFR